MTHKIGVGLVGTGNIAFLHTLGYKNCDDAEIVGLCDLSTKRANLIQRRNRTFNER